MISDIVKNVELLPGLKLNKIDLSNVQWWGCSSVGTESNQQAADTGSTPWCSKEFFSQSKFSVQIYLQCLYTPMCNRMCKSYVHIKDPVVHVNSSVDQVNTKTPNMHHRLGSITLLQLAFSQESNLNFPREKSQWEHTFVNIKHTHTHKILDGKLLQAWQCGCTFQIIYSFKALYLCEMPTSPYPWAFRSSFCFCNPASLYLSTRLSGTNSSQLSTDKFKQCKIKLRKHMCSRKPSERGRTGLLHTSCTA